MPKINKDDITFNCYRYFAMPPLAAPLSFVIDSNSKQKQFNEEKLHFSIHGELANADFIYSVGLAQNAKTKYPKILELNINKLSTFQYDNLKKNLQAQHPNVVSTGAIIHTGDKFINAKQFEKLCEQKFGNEIKNNISLTNLTRDFPTTRNIVKIEISINALPAGSITLEVYHIFNKSCTMIFVLYLLPDLWNMSAGRHLEIIQYHIKVASLLDW